MSTSSTHKPSSNRRQSGSGGGQGNRNRNRNRNRNYNSSNDQRGERSGNSNRSGGRGRPNRRPEKAPEPSLGQKLLKIFTFGLAGGESPAPPARRKSNNNRSSGSDRSSSASRQSASSPSSGGNSRGNRSGDRDRDRSSNKTKRPPEIVEVTTTRLYVGNLAYDATESDLFELFSGVGDVRNAEVVCHRYSQRSKGYAFVEMSQIEEAKRAVEVLHDQDFMDRKLVVSGAKSAGPREGSEDENENEAASEQDAA